MSLGFRDYFRAAFRGWLPMPGIGLLPVNYLILTAIVLATVLGTLAGGIGAGIGILLVGLGLDAAFVLSLTFSRAFQRFLENKLLISQVEEEEEISDKNIIEMLKNLDKYSQGKFEDIRSRCLEIVKLFNQLHPGLPSLELPQLHGLNKLLSSYYQLLLSRQIIIQNVKQDEGDKILAEIQAIGRRLQKETSEKVKKSLLSRLDLLNKRKEKIDQIGEAFKLIESELNRVLDQVELIKADALTAKDPNTFSKRIDEVHTEFEGSSEFAKQQYEILDDLNNLNPTTPNLLRLDKQKEK